MILIQVIIFGVGFFQFTTTFNKLGLKLRYSAAKGYLNPAKKRSNLKIITIFKFDLFFAGFK